MGGVGSRSALLDADGPLQRLAGPHVVDASDGVWTRELSAVGMELPETDARHVRGAVDMLCRGMMAHNASTGNLNTLLQLLVQELSRLPRDLDTPFPWLTNLVFLAQVFIKGYVDAGRAEQLRKELGGFVEIGQTSAVELGSSSPTRDTLSSQLMRAVMSAIVDIALTEATTELHHEMIKLLLLASSVQLYAPTLRPSFFLRDILNQEDLCPLLALRLIHYTALQQAPQHSRKTDVKLSGTGLSLFRSVYRLILFPFEIYRYFFSKGDSETTLQHHCALLFLVLSHQHMYQRPNPVRQALAALHDVEMRDDSAVGLHYASFEAIYAFTVDHLVHPVHTRWSVVLLFTLLNDCPSFRDYIYSKSDVDLLLLPLLRQLYDDMSLSSGNAYIVLSIVLLLSQDAAFCRNVHIHSRIAAVSWYKEVHLTGISLGSLIMTVIVHVIRQNLVRDKDSYLHTTCLAILANMAPHTTYIHNEAAKSLSRLLATLCSRYASLLKRNKGKADAYPTADGDRITTFGEFIQYLLEIHVSCLQRSNMRTNLDLLYNVLHDRRILKALEGNAAFDDSVYVLLHLVDFFDAAIREAKLQSTTVASVKGLLRRHVQLYEPDTTWDPSLFQFEPLDEADSFFLPLLWHVMYDMRAMHWSPHHISLFEAGPALSEHAAEEV